MRLLIALIALLLPASVQARASIDRPALWKIADADTTIWLFGTIHVLGPGRQWLRGPVKRALDGSSELVLETDLSDPAKAQGTIQREAVDASGKPLAQRLPAPLYTRLVAQLAAAGVPPVAVDRVEPWYAAMIVELLAYRARGLVAEQGVEAGLMRQARTQAKPLRALETVEEQISYLDGLPLPLQIELLEGALDGAADAPALIDRLVRAWSRGDVNRLAASINAEMPGQSGLRTRLLDTRNARWAEWIGRRLAVPGTVFVAVGAGHLGGPGNLRALLEAKGLKVRRVQ